MEVSSRRFRIAPALLVVSQALFGLTLSASAQTATLPSILAKARTTLEQTDVRASGRLVRVAPGGARTTTSITIASHWFPEGLRTLLTAGKVRYLLSMEPSGRTSIELLRPGEKSPAHLPASRWSEGVAGTLFSPEDFFDGQFFWTRQAQLPSRKYGARDCFVLKSEPGPGQFSEYAAVTTYIDQKSGAPVYVEAAGKAGAATKQFVFYDLEQNGGVWNARQIEVKQPGHSGSSLLLIDRGSPHAHLGRKDFSLAGSNPTRSGPGVP